MTSPPITRTEELTEAELGASRGMLRLHPGRVRDLDASLDNSQ